MAIQTVTWPQTRIMLPQQCEAELRSSVLINRGPLTAASFDTTEVPFPVWVLTVRMMPVTIEEARTRAAFFAALRGQVKRAVAWMFHHPKPAGTIAGSVTLGSTAAAGATSLVLAATTGHTLKAGDFIGAGGQIFMVMADAVSASGSMTVTVEPPARAQITSGSTVTLNKPTAKFFVTSPGIPVPFTGVVGGEFAVELIEDPNA